MTLISLILEQYRGVFERIYIFSPSIDIDDGWIPVKKYIEQDLGVNTEREQAYWDEWDEAALRRIIQQQRKITEASKKLEIICDDLADVPQLHRPNGALDTLFIRGRHLQISTWVSSQKLRLISAAVWVNQQFLCCWRLRNQHELDAAAVPAIRAGDAGTLQLPFNGSDQASTEMRRPERASKNHFQTSRGSWASEAPGSRPAASQPPACVSSAGPPRCRCPAAPAAPASAGSRAPPCCGRSWSPRPPAAARRRTEG